MKQNIKNNYFTIICTAIIVVFIVAVLVLAGIGKSQTKDIAFAEDIVKVVSSSTHQDGSMGTITVNGKTYYKVETAENLKYALRTARGESYLLMHDFVVDDPKWSESNSATAINNSFYGYVLDGKNNIVEGKFHSITLSSTIPVDPTTEEKTYLKTKLGGLFGKFSGTISNLTYIFSGRIEIMGSAFSDGTLVISCGGFCGEFSGTVTNCNIVTNGSIYVYGQRQNVETYVGAFAGKYLGGQIKDSRLNLGGTYMLYNKLVTDDEQKIEATNNKMFLGGIAGHSEAKGAGINDQPTITNSDIIIGCAMATNDMFVKTLGGEITSTIFGWLPIGAKCNSAEYVLPVGGLFGQSKKITVTGSTLDIRGILSSTGSYQAAQAGVIVGGIIGYVPSDAIIQLSNDTIKLSGKMTTENESKPRTRDNDFHGQVFQGGIIGRFADGISADSYFKNSVIERSNNFYTPTEAKYSKGGNFFGYFSGNTGTNNAFALLNKGNIWVNGGTEGLRYATDTSSLNESTACGLIHSVISHGGGYLTHSIAANGAITFVANQQFSPFYGWYTTPANMMSNQKYTDISEIRPMQVWDSNSGSWVTQSQYVPSMSKTSVVTMHAMFLTTDIYTSGNMVSFADEMNWGLNYDWVEVNLRSDIAFSMGMPVIDKFNGKFNGNGHTITFESGSQIVGNGNVAMFAEISSGASFTNTKIVFAGTVYAGNQDKTALDETTVSAVLVAVNKGYINNIVLDFTGAGVISAFGKNTIVGTLIGINEANKSNTALSQIDLTIDGKVSAVGDDNTIGGLVGVNKSSGKYEMINIFAKGEIISATASETSATVGKATLGGMMGRLEANLYTSNTVINVRDYSNYNNNVLMATCNCNATNYKLLVDNLDKVKRYVISETPAKAKEEVDYVLEDYFGDDPLGIAPKSQELFNDVKGRLEKLSTNLGRLTGSSASQYEKDIISIVNDVKTFDVSAQCKSCSSKTSIFAVAGSSSSGSSTYSIGFDNTWILGSYTQYVNELNPKPSNVGTNKLYYYSKSDTVESATNQGLNLLYVRDGSATCLMDVSSVDANNIKFTVSVDTTKVFTGWYENFNHSTMVSRDYIQSFITDEGNEVQVLQPGTQRGMTVYSGVINSLITTSDVLNQLAITTNAGQTYKGVRFVLGSNINISSDFTSIGLSEENCFDGSLDGKGYTITFENGLTRNIGHTYGLFGYLGESAKITALNVVYRANVSLNDEQGIFGGIAGVNLGTIGQDSTSNKVRVTYESVISGIRVAGGLVGINKGVVQNAEVMFEEIRVGERGQIVVNALGSTDVNDAGVVGGAVGYNETSSKTLLKNTMVSSEVTSARNISNLQAMGSLTYAGGLVGYNASRVYSSVVRVGFESEDGTIVNAPKNYAIIIGYNEIDLTDALWALYAFDPTYRDYAYREPLIDSNGNFVNQLINGEGADNANRLVKYGYGDIKVSIYSNNETQSLGGSIIFEAVEMIPEGKNQTVPFYNYTVSMTKGGAVSGTDGGSGQNFAPTVTTANKTALKGKNYYAVFVKTEISSTSDLYDFFENINSGFKAYANYIIKLSGTNELGLWTSDEGYQNIDPNKEFVGNFNGNGYNIVTRIGEDSLGNRVLKGKALFGIVSGYSYISNLNLTMHAGVEFDEPSTIGNVSAIGSFANINNGVIENVNLTTYASVIGDSDVSYVGGLVGYNEGTVRGIDVTLISVNAFGTEYGGTVVGNVAGGVVGFNQGQVGSERLDSVKITINSGMVNSAVIGAKSAGGIVGENCGTIQNANARIYGRVSSPDVSEGNFIYGANVYDSYNVNVGGIVGLNNSEIISAICYIFDGSKVYSYANGVVGGLVGENQNGIMGTEGDKEGLKSYIFGEVNGNGSYAFGGLVGVNSGTVNGGLVNIRSFKDSETSSEKLIKIHGFENIGGAIGINKQMLNNVSVLIASKATISANSAVGGLIGRNEGFVDFAEVSVDGIVGSTTSNYTGGLIGYNLSSGVSNSFVILNNKLSVSSTGSVGLVSGRSVNINNETINVWAVASNSDTTQANGTGNVGFNALKIVGKEFVNAKFTAKGEIKFTASYITGSSITWYSNISNLESFSSSSNEFIASIDLKNQLYHVCYYDLFINDEKEFNNIYQSVNDNDLFNGVMFRLMNDINITKTVNPIGTEEHPFTGIFDGSSYKITLERGGIAGSDYSGIFGYVSDSAIIRNVIIEVLDEVICGSGMSSYAGILAGRLGGLVENVAINALSSPYSLKSDAKVGALAGYVTAKTTLKDVWTVIYNGSVDAIGVREGATSIDKDDIVNKVSVIGVGKLCVTNYIPDLESVNKAEGYKFTVTEGFDYYDNWYANIGERVTIQSLKNPTVYGFIDYRPTENVIEYKAYGEIRENDNLSKIDFTLSFIDLVIRSEEDFYRFAENINTFGDNKAKFTMDLGQDKYNNYIDELVIDLSRLAPIGTKEHPFTGIFDGMLDTNINASNACYTIRLIGNLTSAENDYTGLFGYVGEGAVIRNLIVRADNATENKNFNGQTIGDKKSIYTGYIVGFLQGSLENVSVVLGDETKLYNINEDSVGGLVGVMGESSSFVNTWLILAENSTYRTVGGYKALDGNITLCDETMVEILSQTRRMPNIIYTCGKGLLNIRFERVDLSKPLTLKNSKFSFILTEISGGESVFGFLPENDDNEVNKVSKLESSYQSPINGINYLAVFLDPVIRTFEDLVNLANITNAGRHYKGIEFYQEGDIVFPKDKFYTSIGGQVSIDESTIGTEYKLVEFIGIYNGRGNKIIIPEGVTLDGAYAGIFGILGKGARIKNLAIEVAGSIGSDSTKYGAPLAGYDNGATLENIIVELKKSASINATLATGRVTVNASLELDAYGNVINWKDVKLAKNVWVLAYNNRFNNESNLNEQAFYDVNKASGIFKQNGVFNGGINIITVIAAGEIGITFTMSGEEITGVNIANIGGNQVKEWYWIDKGEKEDYTNIALDKISTNLDNTLRGQIVYASFLNSEIRTDEDLIALANDTNSGYDFYGLTFKLVNDVVIGKDSNYIGIGADIPFTAIFDGCGNKIIVSEDTIIRGKYAGIFGNIGEYGELKNVILEINGQIGWTKYTAEEVASGNANTMYAGAIAYIQGTLDSVIIIGSNTTIDCEKANDGNTYGGITFGMDTRNLLSNTWVIASADNQTAPFGKVSNLTESSINLMKVVGMGSLDVSFEINDDKYIISMKNNFDEETDYSIKGWYSNYSKDNQLSKALGVTENETDVIAGDRGYYYPKTTLITRRYEVVIINTVITSVEQLISISNDVNKGGYTYENTNFALGSDIVITEGFTSIGTKSTHFKGSFSGYYNGRYHTITMAMVTRNPDSSLTPASVPLFEYNAGIIEDLSVVLATDIRMSGSDVGVVVSYNYGTVSGVIVSFDENKPVLLQGAKVGGIVAVNAQNARVENCLVIVNEQATIRGYVVGGLVAENNGYLIGSTGGSSSDFSNWENNRKEVLLGLTEYASVSLLGTIEVVLREDQTVYGGGAVGVSQDLAYITRVTVRLYKTGLIKTDATSYALGGVVGRSNATLVNSVVINKGKITGAVGGDIGYFVGSIQGTATNSWLVVDVPTDIVAIGNGYDAVNVLQVSGNGEIDAYIDGAENIIFTNITEQKSEGDATIAKIDGWYESNGVTVSDSIGNVDENTFKPVSNITGRTINVVFINLMIQSVEDLIVMAKTVNNGLFAKSLTFVLRTDLVITNANPLTDCIGIYTNDGAYGFKHTFDGANHTITFKFEESSEYASAMLNQKYMGIFGYTSNSATVKNLHIVYEGGLFGTYETEAFGGISGINSGLITNCTVEIKAGVVLTAQKVGGIAGENTRLGTIENCIVDSLGRLSAETAFMSDNTSPNAYSGGLVGLNAGHIENVVVTLSSEESTAISATYHEGSAGATYAGGATGLNSNLVNQVKVFINSAGIVSTSGISAYAGGFSGSNMGTINSSYIKLAGKSSITSSSGIEQVSGGIVGANATTISNVLIDISPDTVAFDSAIGRDRQTTSYLTNVWVYNAKASMNSKVSNVNSMTYEIIGGQTSVMYNDIDEIVTNGTITFDAKIINSAGVTMYAIAESDFKTVLLFDSGYLSYVEDALKFTSRNGVQNIHLFATARRVFNDQTELKALSEALAQGVQQIVGEYSLGSDITVTGNYQAIGTDNHPFNATFKGNNFNVSFTEVEENGEIISVTYGDNSDDALQSMFGYSTGIIRNLCVTYYYSLKGINSAGIAVNNYGEIIDSVVYVALDVTLSDYIAKGLSRNKNCWVISRQSSDGYSLPGSSDPDNAYSSIVVKGKGELHVDREKTILTFKPVCQTENTTFVGFAGEDSTNTVRILSEDPFSTTNYTSRVSYSAEFISSVIENKSDLLALVSVLELQYGDLSKDKTYTMASDISVKVDEILPLNKFLGTFDGNNHILTITGTCQNDGNTGFVFGACEGSESALFKNLTIDVREWASENTKMYLFDDDYAGRLENISILMASNDLRISDTGIKPKVNTKNVYVVTNKAPLSTEFERVTTDGIGLIIVEGEKDLTFETINGKYYATAYEDEQSEVFIGWYVGTFDLSQKAYNERFANQTATTIELNNKNSVYRTTFMSNEISSKEDIVILSNAINNGFDMQGKTFFILEDIELDKGFIIGESNVFKGSIEGRGANITAYNRLFNTFAGSIKDIIIDIEDNKVLFDACVNANLSNLVIISKAENVRISNNTSANLENCWIIASSSDEENVNIVTGNFETLELSASFEVDAENSVNATLISARSKSEEKFIVWYNSDGSVYINDNYFYVEASEGLVDYNVVVTNEISSLDEMRVLAKAVDNDFLYPVYLVSDLVLDGTYQPINNSSCTFYGNGHTIDVVNTNGKFEMFTNLKAVIYDLKVVVNGEQDFEIADASKTGAGLVNCVIELKDNATTNVVGDVNNVWILKHVDFDNYVEFAKTNNGVANILGVKKGEIVTNIDAKNKSITFTFVDDEDNIVLGFVDDTQSVLSNEYVSTYTENVNEEIIGRSVLSYVVDKTIREISDWNNLVNAVNETGNHLAGCEVIIGNDLTLPENVDGNKYPHKLENFEGTLNGNFNSFIVKIYDDFGNIMASAPDFDGMISTTGDGKVVNLAVELFTAPKSILTMNNIENCWVISYVGLITTNAGLIEVVNKGDKESMITVNEKDGNFDFDPNDQDEYKLYHWFDREGYIWGDAESNKDNILTFANGVFMLGDVEIKNVVAEYQECYTIYVDVIDPITNEPIVGVRPDVPDNNTYFPVETTTLSISANLTEDFIFWGFEFDDPYGAVSYDKVNDIKTLNIFDMSKLQGSIHLVAYYSKLKQNFINITYGDLSAEALDEYLRLDSAQLEKLAELNAEIQKDNPNKQTYYVSRTIISDGSTLPLVNSLPKHAGTYKITYSINGPSLIGMAEFEFNIRPKVLHFNELIIEDKIYDSTPYTSISDKLLQGFIDEDNQDIKISTLDFSKIKIAFVDPKTGNLVTSAGNGYNVIITEDSYLESNSTEYHFDIDYALPKGEILYRYTIGSDGTAVQLEPFVFGIEKANLSINIPTITINYLDQFTIDENGNFFDINSLFSKYYHIEGLKEGDYDVIMNAKLLLVEGDEIVNVNGELVYKYNIKQAGSYGISPMSGVLDNYNIDTVTSTARLRINPSPVTVGLNEMTVQYGNKISELDYHFHKDGECVDGNNDGQCDNAFTMSEETYAEFAKHFNLKLSYKAFISKYLSIELATEYVYDNDGTVQENIVPSEILYGVKYRFVYNANFVYADTDAEFIYNANSDKEYIIFGDAVLRIVPREITVEYVGASSKVFANSDSDYTRSARAVGNKLVSGDMFMVTRQGKGTKEGELVGTYPLKISVVDGNGNDVSMYYNMTYLNGTGYSYEIIARTVKVSHLGSNYYYGDLASQRNMRYSTNLNSSVIAQILAIFGNANSKTLEDIGIKLSVGYFGTEIQNIGTYNCEFKFEAPDNIVKCLEFVADAKNCTYTIIPAKLTIQTNSYARDYDKTADITFATSVAQFVVNGFVGGDDKYLVVKNNGYTGDVKANAGNYLYRPAECHLELKSSNGKEYLLDNYVIDKIVDGRYTINPLQIKIGFDIGYYQEDGTFVPTESVYYFGDQSAVLNFYLDGTLPQRFAELYAEEVDETFTDKQTSEWIIKTFELTCLDLSNISADKTMISVSKDNNDLYLRSDNSNITIIGNGYFSVEKVNYILSDIRFVTNHGTNELRLSAKISVVDSMDEPVEHYVFNNEIKDMKATDGFTLSSNSRLVFKFANEYKEGDQVSYTVELLVNTLGTWKNPVCDYVIYIEEGDMLNPITTYDSLFDEFETLSQTSSVEIKYSDWDKLVVIATEKPYVIVGIVIGVLLLVALVSVLGIMIYRKKRITNSAWREIMLEDAWQNSEGDENNENSQANKNNKDE